MAKTLQRDEKNGLLLRETKDGKKFLVKKIPIGNGQFIFRKIKG